jgi:indole-3-glycerol phosphate synthase
MNILDRIVIRKKEEVALAKANVPLKKLEQSRYFNRVPYSLTTFLLDPSKTGIIAEFKRSSPSKGLINGSANVAEVTSGYAAAGASALSVLTDKDFFGGSAEDIAVARAANEIPILRKDFIIDPYQIVEAKAMGADVILLIAAILSPKEITDFASLAKSLGLSVLLEVHSLEELKRSITSNIDAIGVNNRNLADFTVNLQNSFDLAKEIPDGVMKVSESAISDPATINDLKKAGFNGFLIGENFMKTDDPAAAMERFVSKLIPV